MLCQDISSTFRGRKDIDLQSLRKSEGLEIGVEW